MKSEDLLKFIELDEYCKTHSIYDTMDKYGVDKGEIYKIQHILLDYCYSIPKLKSVKPEVEEIKTILRGNTRITNSLARAGILTTLQLRDIVYNTPSVLSSLKGIREMSADYIVRCVKEYDEI